MITHNFNKLQKWFPLYLFKKKFIYLATLGSLLHLVGIFMMHSLSSCTQAWLLCSMRDLSSLTQDRTCILSIGRLILSYWTTREAPSPTLVNILSNLLPFMGIQRMGGVSYRASKTCQEQGKFSSWAVISRYCFLSLLNFCLIICIE